MTCRRRLALLLLVMGPLLGGCQSARERRAAVDEIAASWATFVEEDSLEELVGLVRDLGDGDVRDDPTHLASLTVLVRQAHDNPSALVRAECLRAGWRLAAPLPAEPVPHEGLTAVEFSERSRRFDELTADPASAVGPEAVELAAFLASYRAPPETQLQRQRAPLELAHMVVSRALWEPPSPVRDAFTAGAAGSARHALSLVTLYAADDLSASVREEALRAARSLDPPAALDLIAGTFSLEVEGQVLHAGLDSLAALGRRDDLPPAVRERLVSIVHLLDGVSDVSLAARARALSEALGA